MSQNLRIGMVCYPTYGGSGAVATELGRLLARRGHMVHFISYARPFRLTGDYHENIRHHEISSESYPLFQGPLYTISTAVRMLDIIKTQGLDILHLHYALPHAISAFLTMEMLPPSQRIPTLTTLHGTDITIVGSKPSFFDAVKLGLDRSTRLSAVSEWLSRRPCEVFELCDRIEVIHNFVDPEVFQPVSRRCRRSHFAEKEDKILVHISNFRPVKRIMDVIEVFARVCRETPARLMMLGDGPDREMAQMHAEHLGINERIAWMGNQPGVEEFLPMADAFIFPSEGESFGLAALEAMACGVPVIGAHAGGLPEVIEEGVTGFMLPVGDVEGMAKATLRVINDAELHERMSRASRQRAVEHFGSDKIIPQYEALYHRLLAQPLPVR